MPLPLASVLLVDDDPTANFLHQLLLTRLGVAAHLTTATDGQQALDALGSAPPALILLDLNMPVLNGFEFLERYLAVLPPGAVRPVVALLSSSEQALAQARARQLPADAYLTKPLTREQVQALLAQHFAAAGW